MLITHPFRRLALGAALLLLLALTPCHPLRADEAKAAITAPAPNFLKQIGSFKGHKNAVNGVAFSLDGLLAATASWDEQCRLFDARTGNLIRNFTGHEAGVRCLAFTPDGKQLLSGSWDATARLWDVGTGQEIRKLQGHEWPVLGLAISPDGQRALTCSDGIRLWNLQTGESILKLTGHTATVWSVAFSPDGQRALSGSADETMRLWDLKTGTEIRRFTGHNDRVLSVQFAPDGATAFSCCTGDNAVRQWNLTTGEEIRRFETEQPGIACLAVSPDGTRLVAGEGQNRPDGSLDWSYPLATAYCWNVADGKLLAQTASIKGYISGLAFSTDGTKLLSCGYENSAKVWDLAKLP